MPTATPTPPQGSGSTAPKFVYALNGSADVNSGVAEFRIDPATGVLSMLGTAPVPVMHTDEGEMAATPQTGFVYVAQWLTKTIVVLHADPNSGLLTQSEVVSVPELMSPPELTTDPAGKLLYLADPNGFQVIAFAIQASGNLVRVPGSPFKISSPPIGLTMDATGKFLFTGADHQVFGFTVAANGALTPTPDSPVTVRPPFITPGKGPTWVSPVLDPKARFLFVEDTTNPVMFVYSLSGAGTLAPVAGSPFPTRTTGRLPAVDPAGKFVFVSDAVVDALAVNQQTGSLTPVPGSPFDNGPFRNGGAPVCDTITDPSGKFLLLADCENSLVTVFSIDANSGALTNVSGSPFAVAAKPIGGGSPSAVVVTH
jgi:6-phosphogluconolactonase (cycloisomerase 2 family)